LNPEVIAALLGAVVGAVVGSGLTFGLGLLDRRLRDRRQAQLDIFRTMVKFRAQVLHTDAVAAVNLIDLVFADAREVRAAHEQFLVSVDDVTVGDAVRRERFRRIIEAMSRHLGLSQKLTAKDIDRAWYPGFMGKSVDVLIHETNEKWAKIPPEQRSGGL
jgi:hypothetical protein